MEVTVSANRKAKAPPNKGTRSRRSRKTSNTNERESLLRIGSQWELLAERKDAMERKPKPGNTIQLEQQIFLAVERSTTERK